MWGWEDEINKQETSKIERNLNLTKDKPQESQMTIDKSQVSILNICVPVNYSNTDHFN
jgi:hypothetical protein